MKKPGWVKELEKLVSREVTKIDKSAESPSLRIYWTIGTPERDGTDIILAVDCPLDTTTDVLLLNIYQVISQSVAAGPFAWTQMEVEWKHLLAFRQGEMEEAAKLIRELLAHEGLDEVKWNICKTEPTGPQRTPSTFFEAKE